MLCRVSKGAAPRVAFRVRDVHGRCRPDLVADLQELYESHDWVYDTLASRPEARFLQGRRPVVVGWLGGLPTVVKRLHHGGLLAPLTGDRFLSPRRALANLATVDALNARGLTTPDLLFAAWRRRGAAVRMEMGFEMVQDSEDAAVAVFGGASRPPVKPAVAIEAVGRLVAALHRSGVFHHDLNLRNFLLTRDGRVLILDVDKASMGVRPLCAAARRRNLARLARSVRKLGRGAAPPDVVEALVDALMTAYRIASESD